MHSAVAFRSERWPTHEIAAALDDQAVHCGGKVAAACEVTLDQHLPCRPCEAIAGQHLPTSPRAADP